MKNIHWLDGIPPVQGDVIYFDGTEWQILPAGTSGQFLKTNGSGANPAWATIAPNDAAVDPLTLSPYIYLSADSGVYNDAGVTLCTNGQSVQQWNDLSGNGRHFAQATAGKKPTYRTTGSNVINSLPVIDFDGGDCMTRASVAISSFTILSIFRNTGATRLVYEHGPNVSTNDGSALLTTSGATLNVRKGGVTSSANFDATWGQNGTWIIAVHQYSVEGVHARHTGAVNNWNGTPGVVTGNNPGISTITDTMNLGARNDAASLGLVGSMAVFLVFTPAITFENLRRAMLFLQRKWDL